MLNNFMTFKIVREVRLRALPVLLTPKLLRA